MTGSIFSSYSSAENRVTACFLAVLRSLAIHRIERILRTLLIDEHDEEFSLICLRPLPPMAKGAKAPSRPDGEISSACQIYAVETKIVLNGLIVKSSSETISRSLNPRAGRHVVSSRIDA